MVIRLRPRSMAPHVLWYSTQYKKKVGIGCSNESTQCGEDLQECLVYNCGSLRSP